MADEHFTQQPDGSTVTPQEREIDDLLDRIVIMANRITCLMDLMQLEFQSSRLYPALMVIDEDAKNIDRVISDYYNNLNAKGV